MRFCIGNSYQASVTGGVTTTTKYYYFGAQRVAMKQGSTLYYLHADHLGSSSVTSDAGGDPVGTQVYFPFGTPRASTGNLQTDFTFTGQKFDQSDSLMYYGARYYDAQLGRFISADTIVPSAGNPQALNRYAYVLNNPLKYTDPTGHCGDADDLVCEDAGQGGGVTPPPPPPGCRSDPACTLGSDPSKPSLPYRGQIPEVTIQRLVGSGVPESLLRSAVLQVGTPEAEWLLFIYGEPPAVTRSNVNWSAPYPAPGEAIFVQPANFDPDSLAFALLIAHEIRHVEQMQRDWFFDFKYAFEWATKGYDNVSYEEDARNYAALIRRRRP